MRIRIAVLCLAAAGLSSAQAQAQDFTSAPRLLVHGNYCGLDNRAPLRPVDALDRACARHDACTPEGELPSRLCNLRLSREAELISRDPRRPDDVRAAAGFIAFSAAAMPFDPAPRAVMVATLGIPGPYVRQRTRVGYDY
ncbi:hypothetical protein [Methylobacterium sp. Leaf361]|uniref:hypothetical protein n=1 Tax=Methylobacterium sp. Leaf361 TaxID=1736352 RepID=UPI001FCE0970|nr:hypothetical protein [Methylobacterium sp. Leaf361]